MNTATGKAMAATHGCRVRTTQPGYCPAKMLLRSSMYPQNTIIITVYCIM
ncbi:hypothetical protein Hanom_Chr04g00344071 [Helianthus anomalus]